MSAPVATYRIQFRQGMTFDRAIENLPHIRNLGISHVYASPIFTATSGSSHGYDVTDMNEIDPAIGGREGFDRFVEGVRQHGLGLILDIVPNHMAASPENRWWWDVVAKGTKSAFADYFDIDWSERLTLPHLGKTFADAVADCELTIEPQAEGGWNLAYYDARYPLSATSIDWLMHETGDDPDVLSAFCKSPEKMEALHDQQHWQLMHWKEAAQHLSYRRFFEVTGLVGLRVEDPRVFEDSHRLVLSLVSSGAVQGLRLDHIDGLADPAGYLTRLRKSVGNEVYIVAEKILGPGEVPRPEWPISGTTGYEFITAVSHLFIEKNGLERLEARYREQVPSLGSFEQEQRHAKLLMATRNFAGEVSRLVRIAGDLLPKIEQSELAAAIRELLVAFPVYRTYGTANDLSSADVAILEGVASKAKRFSSKHDVIDAVADLLRSLASETNEFRTRFQQLTGPVMAKAMEDTLFYRYNCLIAANEVGGEPEDDPGGAEPFHNAMLERIRTQPQGLTATSTHDTKRGEDARARLYAISEDADAWADHVGRWQRMNEDLTGQLATGQAPDRNTQWILYQALLGVLPDKITVDEAGELQERFSAYALKAVREAKMQTDWAEPDEVYEAAVTHFASALLSGENRDFLFDFIATAQPYIASGYLNSLTQTLFKMIAPGIPDFYQGAEGFDLSLVDPDNRRPVDYPSLSAEEEGPVAHKLKLIRAGLRLRTRHPHLFSQGDYVPLKIQGARADHVVSFMRKRGDDYAIAITPRLMFSRLNARTLVADPAFWADTRIIMSEIPGVQKQDLMTGRTFSAGDLHVRDVLSQPIALLVSAE